MHRARVAKQEQVAGRQFRKTHALRILRRAVDHCQELIFLTDADGVLQYVNPSCEIVTGYSASQLIDQKVSCIASQTPKGDSWDSMRREALHSCKSFKPVPDGGHPTAIGSPLSLIGSAMTLAATPMPFSFKMPTV